VSLWADINVGNTNHRGATMRRIILLVALLFAASAYAGHGWYLLTPPKIPGVMEFDEKAPLERWEHHGAFDSAEDCERNLDVWRARAMDQFKLDGSIENKYLSGLAIFSRCIASDDPRLK
jgi:hypothetical protein